MTNKVSQRLEVFDRLRPYLTSSAANTIYKAFSLPILDYCDIYWRSVGSTLAEKLERLQKRASRVMLREGSSKDPVLQLAWTKLLIRRQQHLCTFIFKRLQGFVGTEPFFIVQPVSYNNKTRSNELNVVLPAVRTEFRKK